MGNKISVVVGPTPSSGELAMALVNGVNGEFETLFVKDFAILKQLASPLKAKFQLKYIFLFLENKIKLNKVNDLNILFPGTTVLVLITSRTSAQLQSPVGLNANRYSSEHISMAPDATLDAQENRKELISSATLDASHLSSAKLSRIKSISARVALTPRELQLLKLLYRGLSYSKCAESMNIQFSTVQSHIRNTYRKLSVTNNRQAILEAQARGLINF